MPISDLEDSVAEDSALDILNEYQLQESVSKLVSQTEAASNPQEQLYPW